MIPSSRPILPLVTAPPVGEIPRHSLLTAQSTASSLNSRYRRTSRHKPGGTCTSSNLRGWFIDWL